MYNNNVNESNCNSSPILPTNTTYIAVHSALHSATRYPRKLNSKSPVPAHTPPSVVNHTAACTRAGATFPIITQSIAITNGVVADFNTPYIGMFIIDSAFMSSTSFI